MNATRRSFLGLLSGTAFAPLLPAPAEATVIPPEPVSLPVSPAPQAVTVQKNNTGMVTIEWSGVDSSDVVGYEVWINRSLRALVDAHATKYSFMDTVTGTSADVEVKSVDHHGIKSRAMPVRVNFLTKYSVKSWQW